MKVKFIETKIDYDGSQLRPLFNYLEHGLLGDSAIAFRGACEVAPDKMLDGEDLRQGAKICGDDMLHFIVEVFDRELVSAVLLQRLFASILAVHLPSFAPTQSQAEQLRRIRRDGDDLYLEDRKLSISVASKTTKSALVHFAVNVRNQGTPVKTCALEDFGVEAKPLAEQVLAELATEWTSILQASWKVL